MKYLEIKLWKC